MTSQIARWLCFVGLLLFSAPAAAAQTGDQCKFSLTPANRSHGSGAETDTISVSATPGCKWNAAANVSWITITSGSSGIGDGTVTYSLTANTSNSVRNGAIFIGGQTFGVKQDTPCPFTLSPSSRSHGSEAEAGTISVQAPSGCKWTATSNASWIVILSSVTGSGDGTVNYMVAANNANTARNGVILIGSQTFAISQANRCPFSLVPASRTHTPDAQTGDIAVKAPGGCGWTAKSNVPWIKITSGSSGEGDGTVTYEITANATPADRTGTMTIAGLTFTITQPTSCIYSISPEFRIHKAVIERGSVNITTTSACTWTAVSNATWIKLGSAKSGVGNGSVSYTLEANPGNRLRDGTITIAGKTFTVYQEGVGCPYFYEPFHRSHGTGTETGNFKIVMTGLCPYTLSSDSAWIVITSPAKATGGTAVSYRLAANTTPQQRKGGISLDFSQGQFSITQDTPCPNFAIDPVSRTHGTGSETGTITVSGATGCTWTASPGATWITITAGKTGSGDGVIKYSVKANTGPTSRTGSITIAGKTFAITQPTSCPISISPSTRSHGGGAETGIIFVSVPEGCPWTATSTVSWIVITAGKNGNGDGVVTYTLAANPGLKSRTGTINFPGVSFTVTQEPSCPFSLAPTSRTHGPAAEKGSVFVSGPGDCSWTAKSNVNWILITAGVTGKGDGVVNYSVAANTTGATRSGAITIAGQTFTLTQSSGGPDLALSKRHIGTFNAGENGSYVLTVDNVGSVAITGTITVIDNLPAGTSFVSATGTGWSCSASGQVVTCTNAGPLATGDSSSITLTVNVSDSAPQQFVNTATLSHAKDANFFNNAASDRVALGIEQAAVLGATRYAYADRGGMSITTLGSSDTPVIGYARVQPDSGQTSPSGLAIFGLRQNGILVSEAGVPVSVLLQTARIYAEVSDSVNTGLAIANPNDQDAMISFYFTDADGVDFGAGDFTIPANGQIATFLNQEPFNGGSSINGTLTFNANIPVAAIALRGFTNERSEFLITTLPVVELLAEAPGAALFPHFADGGGWTTQLVLINPTDQVIEGTVQFVGQGSDTTPAEPVAVAIEGETESAFAYTIAPRSSRRLSTSGAAAVPKVGSIRLIPAEGSGAPAGLGIFSLKNAGVTVTEASVPLLRPEAAFRMYAEVSSQPDSIRTGVAIANPSPGAADVNFELTTLSGGSLGLTGKLVVPGTGQTAVFLDQIPGFESLPVPFQGLLRLSTSSPQGISVIGLRGRTNERGDFLITTTAPVNEASGPMLPPVLLPHFVDGGGYITQFLLFSGSAGQASTGRIDFFSQSGQPLSPPLK
ncbi:MAG TPA: BACON domain-containing carbohydrate-binding protein [Acidobacteriota bacterium]